LTGGIAQSSHPRRGRASGRRTALGAGAGGVGRDATWLAGSALVSGLAAYGYILLGTREFGGAAFAPVSVLWSLWAISTALLSFPVQHWIVRSFRVSGGEGEVRAHAGRLLATLSTASLALGVATWMLRDQLFGSEDPLYPILAGVVCFGTGLLGFTRGVLAGRDRFRALGGTVAGENLLRLAIGAITVGIGADVGAFAAAIALGPLVIVLVPRVMVLGRETSGGTGSVVRGKGGLLGSSLVAVVLLSAPPVLVAGLGGAPIAISSMFAALALFRVPYMLVTVLATRISRSLVELVVEGQERYLDRLLRILAISAPAGALLAAMLAGLGGESLVRAVFGGDLSLSDGATAAIGAGSVLAVGSLLVSLLLAARGQATTAAYGSLIGAGAGVATIALLSTAVVPRVLVSFVAAEAVMFAALCVGAMGAKGEATPARPAGVLDEPTI
jgi:hypothetical protein